MFITRRKFIIVYLEFYQKIGVIVENDIKSLYVAGDVSEIQTLFKRIERFIIRISGEPDILEFKNFERDIIRNQPSTNRGENSASLDQLTKETNGRRGTQQVAQARIVKSGVDIMRMDTNKAVSESESTLEFILNTLCKALQLKPKQAAALLTNNNQFLSHCCIKGVKGAFEPMITWYNDVFNNSRHLTQMLEIEAEAIDQKGQQAAKQNFQKLLQTISCGCLSQNEEVARLCLKTLQSMGEDFSTNPVLNTQGVAWFNDKTQGFDLISQTLKNHPKLGMEIVKSIAVFCKDANNLDQLYNINLLSKYLNPLDYIMIIKDLLSFMVSMHKEEELEQEFLPNIIEYCLRNTEPGYSNTLELRTASISLLSDLWLSFTNYLNDPQRQDVQNAILQTFQKSQRDKFTNIRIVAIAHSFTLLDILASEKQAVAPTIYKQLIFSFVENPYDYTIRQIYLSNFQNLFEKNKQIPVALLIDPLLKSMQNQDTYTFEIFDYDFLSFISRHPKLQASNAVQILDLLAKHQLSDVCNAGAAQIPFIQICAHFLPNENSCYDFLIKFITICINQLLQIENALQSDVRSSLQKNKMLALPAPGRSGSRGASKQGDPNTVGKDFIIHGSKKSNSSQKQRMIALNPEDSVNHRLKRSHILNILFKIQNLRVNEINQEMKNIILAANKQYRDQNDIPHAGMQALLRYWGDPEAIYQQYSQRIDQERQSLDNLDQVKRQSKNDRKILNYDSEGSQTNMVLAPYDPKIQKGVTRKLSGVLAISESTTNYRALQELEFKKKQRIDKQLEEQKKIEAENKKKTLVDNKLKDQIAKKRVQQGILSKVGGVQQEMTSIIQDPKETEKNKLFRNTMPKQVQLVNLEDEEDRDQEMVASFMKKYSKIWRFLFGRYANQMYSIKGRENFEDLKKNTSQISMPEVLKMIKEHDIYPQLISKDELSCLFRLINQQTQQANSNDILMLDFNQYVQLIPQLAFVCYSRPPIDKSATPPIFMLYCFIEQLEQANRNRGKPTGIYEDPDMSNFTDKELIKALEIKVNKDPSYPLPEGFKKVLEKTPIFQYALPQCAKSVLDPGKIIATELLDEILNKALQVHFLEPLVTFETKYKVKSQINRSSKPPTSDALGYMKKVEKIIDEKKQVGTAFANMTAAEKRNLNLEVKPQLSLALKLQVTKQDLKNRPNYQEVAEVLEEMLIAIDKGFDFLPPRQTKAPGQYVNDAKRQKEEKEQEAAELERQREYLRQKRDAEAKKLIKETAFGGKNMPTKKFRALKEQVKMEEQEKLEREERKKFQQQTEKERRRIDEIKQKQLDEIEKKKQEDRKKEEAEKKAADETNKRFLAQQKEKLTKEFKDNINKRDELIQKKEENKKVEKDSEDNLKEQMEKYIKDTKGDRGDEKQEREAINAFLEVESIKQIFQLYDKPLNNMFKFYSNQDSKKEILSYGNDLLANTLSFKELVRFNYQQQITPQFINPEDVVNIHKTLIRETVDEEKKKPQDQRNPKKSDFIDFIQFKKALVRIAVIAQEKLGVGNEDMLKKKLEEDSKIMLQEKQKKDALLKQITVQDEKKKNQLDDLRNKFQEEKQQKDIALSRGAKDKKPHEANTLQQKQKDELKQYQLDEGKLAQEEQFFQKWLKQRENLGVKEDEDINDVKAKLVTKKDPVQNEINLLEAKKKDKQRQLSVKVEQKQVRKKFDINIINVDTIEALFQYLELDLPERDASRRLTLLSDSRKQTISNKATGLNNYNSQASLHDTLPKNTPAKQLNEIKEQPLPGRKDSAVLNKQSTLTKNTIPKQNDNAPPSQQDKVVDTAQASPTRRNGLNKDASLSKLDQSRNSITKQEVVQQ